MLAETTAFGISIVEWAIIFGLALGAAEILGVSKSGRTARKENVDLRERNKTLEQEAMRLDAELAQRDTRIGGLERRVTELETELGEVKRRDQGAVLEAISEHESNAGVRSEQVLGVLVEIRDRLVAR